MISDAEIALLSELSKRLSVEDDSDRVREGRALAVLIEAHDELKKPHLQALEGTITGPAAAVVNGIGDTLDIAVSAAYAEDVPEQSRLVALRISVRSATAEIRRVTATT